jgi:hypothetical protein
MSLSWRDFQLDAELEGRSLAKTHLSLVADTDPFSILDGNRRHAAWAQWFADLFHQAGYTGTAHLRRFHYRLVSLEEPVPMVGSVDQDYAISDVWIVPNIGRPKKGEKPGDIRPNTYGNTDWCWQQLCKAGKWARHLGLVDAELIEDNRSPVAIVPPADGMGIVSPEFTLTDDGWETLQDGIKDGSILSAKLSLPDCPDIPTAMAHGINAWSKRRSHHLEIWIEKSSMNDILLPICRRYGIVLQSLVGESSLTRTGDLLRRIRSNGGKPARIIYVSDFDPAGNSMPAAASRRIEHLVRSEEPDLQLQLTALALTREQVAQFNLPTIPIKESEVRGNKFRERQNTDGAVELDALEALHPGALAQMVEGALAPYLQADEDWQEELQDLEREMDDQAEEINEEIRAAFADRLGPHQEAFDALISRAQARYRRLRGQLNADLQAWLAAAATDYEAAEAFAWEQLPSTEDWPVPEPEVIDEDDPLLDTDRDYIEQLDRYRQHKGIDP